MAAFPVPTFANQGTQWSHWYKHIVDQGEFVSLEGDRFAFGDYIDPETYQAYAQEIVENARNGIGRILQYVRTNEETLFFNQEDNSFVALREGGEVIKTLFQPRDGVLYYEEQVAADGGVEQLFWEFMEAAQADAMDASVAESGLAGVLEEGAVGEVGMAEAGALEAEVLTGEVATEAAGLGAAEGAVAGGALAEGAAVGAAAVAAPVALAVLGAAAVGVGIFALCKMFRETDQNSMKEKAAEIHHKMGRKHHNRGATSKALKHYLMAAKYHPVKYQSHMNIITGQTKSVVFNNCGTSHYLDCMDYGDLYGRKGHSSDGPGNLHQTWLLIPATKMGFYYIQNKATGHYLQCVEEVSASKGHASDGPKADNKHQQWVFLPSSTQDKCHYLRNRVTGMYLECAMKPDGHGRMFGSKGNHSSNVKNMQWKQLSPNNGCSII